MKPALAIALLFLVCTQTLHAQNVQTKLKNYFSALRENQQFNGNILIVEKGKTIYEQSFGYADFENKELNSKNTVFPVASISKTITATAILQLAQAGKLKVSDPVVKHLPDFPYPAITIRHLLSHTSGLPPYNAYFDSTKNANPGKVFTNADFMDGLVKNTRPLIYQPGEKGNYDNINFIVLAEIIEKLSGMRYDDYVRKYILQPAGMTNTAFAALMQYAPAKKDFAFPYLQPRMYSDSMIRANTVPYVASYWKAYNFHGFGDYTSTTHDLLKYDRAYGKLLNKELINEAYTPVKLNNGNSNPGNFALGWEIGEDSSLGKIVYHAGAATGLSCVLIRNISRQQTIILFDNTKTNAQEMAMNALKILNGVDVPSPKKSLTKTYAKMLLKNGADAAKDMLTRLRKDTLNYYLSEDEMNLLGYNFMGGANNPNPFRFPEEHKYKEAIETFKLNTELFPNSWNVYDSYGEALLTVGQKEEAIRMYKKSVELNPNNDGGKKVLEELSK